MKRLFSSLMLIALLAIVSAGAMAQNSFNYQGVIREGGKIVENKSVNLRLSVMLDDKVYYSEQQEATTNAYGNVSVSVGEGTPLTGKFEDIPWQSMRVMLQVEVSTDGSDNYTNMGSMQIQPVPYAFYAARASVIQPAVASDEPIFQVKDNAGNLLFAVYETGVKVFVDDNKNDNNNSKAAKSKFAVAGRSAKKGEETLLTINSDGTTVFVDDNDNKNANKAAKSRFAVSGRSAKNGKDDLLSVDGAGSTIYVGGEGKAAKSKFAVVGQSASKAENNYSLDGDGSTVYVDFTDNDAKGGSDVLSIDGSQATFYIDIDNDNKNDDYNKNGKAAKSKFAVVGSSANKDVQTAFIIDGTGTLIYIDDIDDSKTANNQDNVSRFIVAGHAADINSSAYNDKFFTINRDSTRIYINDQPMADDTAGVTPVVTPSLASSFAIVGMAQNTDLLIVKKDSTIIKTDTYVAEEVQSNSGEVEKIVDDSKAVKAYVVGNIYMKFEKEETPYYENDYESIKYTYYYSENGEYLYLKYNWYQCDYEYRNYWLVDGKIYRDTTYAFSGTSDYAAPIYEWKNDWRESYAPQQWDGKNLLVVLESNLRNDGYKVEFDNCVNIYFGKLGDTVLTTQNNIVTSMRDTAVFKKYLGTFISLIEPAIGIVEGNFTMDIIEKFSWDLDYALFGDDVTSQKIVGIENTEATTEHEVFEFKDQHRKHTLKEIEDMFAAIRTGFVVTAKPNNPALGSVQVSPAKERYAYGEIMTLTPVIDKHIFMGWSDGCTDTVRNVCVTGNASYTAIFEEPVLYVSAADNANDENYGFAADKPLASISGAIDKINQFGNTDSKLDWTIIILDTLTEPQTIKDIIIQDDATVVAPICANKIIITGNGTDGNAVLHGSFDGENEEEMGGALLSIATSVPVTIENLTIMGGCTQYADGSGISIEEGCNVTLGKGVVVALNKGFSGCGGVCVAGAETKKSTLTITNGCQITNNITNNIGGGVKVCEYAELIMNGGEISGNSTVMYHGGGVYVDNNAKFTMSGGDIISNTASGNGGGVYLKGNESGISAEFVMNGGTISGNNCGDAFNGSGVYINGLAYFASLKMSETATVTDDIYFAPSIINFDKLFNGNTDDEGFEYIEVDSENDNVPYTIAYAESGVELTGTIDGNQFSGQQNGELLIGKHTLVATINKGNYVGMTITKKVNVVKSLAAASFAFGKEFNEGVDYYGFEYVEVASDIETVPVAISNVENDAELFGTIDDFSFSGSFSGILEIGEHTLIATVRRDNYTDKTVVRKIKVVKTLDDASITFGTAFNGNIDDEGFEYIEVVSSDEKVPYNISGESGTTLTCSITKNDEPFSSESSGELAIGSYTIVATVHKDYYGDVTVTKNVKVVKSLAAPSITVGNNENWFEYVEVASADEKVPYTINSTESGATLTGYVGEEPFEGSKSGELAVGSHTIIATVRKDNYNEVTVTRNINVVVALQGASFLFGKAFNGFKDTEDNEYIEVASNSDEVSYTIKSIENDVTLTGSVDGTSFTGTKNGTLAVGQHTLTATISKENQADVIVTKKIMIVKSLAAASFLFGKPFNGYKDSNGFEYIEVASNSENVSYSVASGESGVSVSCTNNGSIVANSGTLSIGEHTLIATVHKDCYTDVVVTKKVKVVKSLTAATFTFGKQSNGNTDSNGYEYFEVSSSSGTISYTIANPNSENGVSLSGTVDGTKYNGQKSGTLAVGSHTLIATIHIDNQADVIVTRKIMVVKTLAPASISFGKAFSGYSSNGFDYIEVASNSTTVSYSVTSSESGVSIVSTINNSSVANSGNLAIGEHTIQVTVRKNCYTDVTVTKKVKVVRELQEPSLNFSSDYNASYGNGTSENSNYTSGKGYLVKDVSLKNDGTGYLNYSFSSSDNATITITENGSGISTSGKLNIGPHTLTVTVAKSLYVTKTFTKKIYIQGTLNDATISSSNGTNTSGNNWQFSYLRYNDMSVSVSVGNTGNSISVTAGGSSKGTSFSLSHGFSGNIVVTQTRQYCKTKTTTKTMNVTIKPVTWKVGDCCLYYDADDAGSECEIYGTVYLGKNGSYSKLRSFSNITFALKAWDCFNHENMSFTLTSPSDYICYKSEDMKEEDVTKWDEIGEVSRDVTLETLADWERNNNGVYFTVWNSSGDSMGHRIYYTISD